MIVVAIIALLAAIAIPNLLRARISANDSLAKSTLRAMSTASETYGTTNSGNYPEDMSSLVSASPAYINTRYCDSTVSGFYFKCINTTSRYSYDAFPVTVGTSGSTTYTMVTGGILTP
jgi:type II secretory pathway pseudopilin PulG